MNESEKKSDLFFSLSEWDGKSKQSIGQIYQAFRASDELIDQLLDLFSSLPVQTGATWLFKRHCEANPVALDKVQSGVFNAALKDLEAWEAKLHVLQSIPLMANIDWQLEKIVPFLNSCISSENKFVRAWAYYGWAELAVKHDQLRPDAESVIASGFETEKAGSILARLRKARSRLGENL